MDKTFNRTVLTILLTIPLIAQAGAAGTAKEHIRSMMQAGERMMSHGEQGQWGVMVRQAEAMREHARAALEAVSSEPRQNREVVERLREAIGHLDELIGRGTDSHGEILMAHAKKAMAHARQAARYARRSR